jgi:uncharacterized protein involved in exopolysaccharide biosynthesis
MKNNNLQEGKPVYIHEPYYSTDDEISLIDLTMVLVRRKRMIAITTTFIIALGVIAALLTPKSYTFSTTIDIGSQIIGGTIKPFESPQTLLAKIQHVFIPQTLNEQRQTNSEDIKNFKIKASIPKNSVIIILKINGTENESDLITGLLQNVTQQAIQDHQRIYNAAKQNLLALKEQLKTELAALEPAKDNWANERRLLKSNLEVHVAALANLRNTHEIMPPMRSIEATGTSRKLIVIIAAFLGIFLAVFAAFLAEFIAKVKEKSQADN